jgi:peptide/nickel transport system permease protein
VSELISGRLWNSVVLALVTFAIMIPLSLLLGILAAIRRGRTADHVISGLSVAAIALPEFVTGTMLALGFAVSLKLLPPVSLVPPGQSPLADPSVLVLPVATLLIAGLAYSIRMVRAGMVEAMASDYVQMARLHGIPERRVIWRHALPNALAPSIQVFALTVQWLVGGIVVVETVFQYPGIGQGLVRAVVARDIPVVQAVATMIAVVYIAINIAADLIVVLLIPKLRTASS